MSEVNGDVKNDEFLTALENSVRSILRGKGSKADKLAAINAGIRLAAIKHKVYNGESEEGFFGK
jgi:hypothetical protein